MPLWVISVAERQQISS